MSDDAHLETERLLLRPWRDEDLEPFARINADPRVMNWMPKVLTRAESDALVQRFEARRRRDGLGPMAVIERQSGRLVGTVGLSHSRSDLPFAPCVEVLWRMDADRQGRGYATEAAAAVIGDGFERSGLREIVAFTAIQNHASRAVMTKLGMTYDQEADFDHPGLAVTHALRRHVLYRLSR